MISANTNRSIRAVGIAAITCSVWLSDVSIQTVSAESLQLTYQGMGARRFVSVNFNGAASTVRGGVFKWGGSLRSFCTQLEENLTLGSTVDYEIVPVELVPDEPPSPGPMGISRATLVRDLYARWYYTVMSKTGTEGRDYAAAFQMNIWEITHQNVNDSTAVTALAGMNLNNGNASFASNSNAQVIAQNMLNSLGGGIGNFLGFDQLRGLTSPVNQDQLIVVPGIGGLAACIGLAGIRTRRRR